MLATNYTNCEQLVAISVIRGHTSCISKKEHHLRDALLHIELLEFT